MNPESVDQTCVLVPGEVHLAATGSDVGTVVVVAGVLIAVGVVLLALVVLIRRRKGQPQRPARALASVGLAALMIFGLSVAMPSVSGAFAVSGLDVARPAETAPLDTGCDLISWEVISDGLSTPLDETPVEVLRVRLTNVTAFAIELSFNTEVTSDPGGLADYVAIVGTCADCIPTATVLNRMLAQPTVGPAVQVASGQTVTVSFDGSLASGVPNSAQNQVAIFSLIANTRQLE